MAQDRTAELELDARKTAEGTLDDVKAGASRLADRGSKTVNDVLDAGRDYADRIRDAGQDYAGRAYETGQKKAEEAAFYAELGYEEAIDWTRSHPAQALGIAAAIGFLIGVTIARR